MNDARRKLVVLHSGDLITIQWSGELRTVAVFITDQGACLYDLTDAEKAEIERETAAAEAARWAEAGP